MKRASVAILFLALIGVARAELGLAPTPEEKPLAPKKELAPERGRRAPFPGRSLGSDKDSKSRDDSYQREERSSGGHGHSEGGRGGGSRGGGEDDDD